MEVYRAITFVLLLYVCAGAKNTSREDRVWSPKPISVKKFLSLKKSNLGPLSEAIFKTQFKVKVKCNPRQRGHSCFRACHPEDCLILKKGDEEKMKNVTTRGFLEEMRSTCVDVLAKQSSVKGCYNKDRVNKVAQEVLDMFVYRSNPELHLTLDPVYDIHKGGYVQVPTMFYAKQFTICTKFVAAVNLHPIRVTELVSFTFDLPDKEEVDVPYFTVLIAKHQVFFQMHGIDFAKAYFKTPFPLLANRSSLLCFSYRRKPNVEVSAWIRQDGELLTRLNPYIVMPFNQIPLRGYSYFIGKLTVGKQQLRVQRQFIGAISVAMSDEFLSSPRQVLPILRCKRNYLQILKTRVMAERALTAWAGAREFMDILKKKQARNKRKNRKSGKVKKQTVIFHGAAQILHNVTRQMMFCGASSCASCMSMCSRGRNNCTKAKECASCEELSCPDHIPHLQGTYKSQCLDKQKKRCTEDNLKQCFRAHSTTTGNITAVNETFTCKDVKDAIRCLNNVDLGDCTPRKLTHVNDLIQNRTKIDSISAVSKNLTTPTGCSKKRSQLTKLVKIRPYTTCARSCLVDRKTKVKDMIEIDPVTFIPFLNNSKLCNFTLQYRKCLSVRGCSEYSEENPEAWLLATVTRLAYLQREQCLLPPSCQKILDLPTTVDLFSKTSHGEVLVNKRKLGPVDQEYRKIAGNPAVMKLLLVPLPTYEELMSCKK